MALTLSGVVEKIRNQPPRLKVTGAIILGGVIMVVLTALVDQMMSVRRDELVSLRAELVQKRQQSATLRRQLEQYPELVQKYEAAISKGIMSPLDSVVLVNRAKILAEPRHLSELRFKVEPVSSGLRSVGRYTVDSSLVSFESGAILDSDAMAFWNDILAALPGHYQVVEASLERVGEIDASFLANLRNRPDQAAVRSRLTFRTVALRSPTSEAQK